jgi:membrane-associated protease RseP (regulator of RpoE activity)
MPDTPPPPLPPALAPDAPSDAGAATRLASKVSTTGYGVDPDQPGVRHGGLRLALLLAALAALAVANTWMFVVIMAVVVMIFLHELGHYVMAKRAGMKVTEFFLGFGPKIWSFQRGETEYGIKLIPAGAYVKIPGMTNLDEVAPEDEDRTYRQKSFWDRIGVAVAGSTMHFLLALVLIYVALVFVGEPNGSLTSNPADRPARVESVIDGSGADDAGLQPGDEVTSVAGEPTPTVTDLTAAVGPNRGTTVPVTVDRGGEELTVDVDLRAYTYVPEEAPSAGVQRGCGLGIRMAEAPVEQVSPIQGLVEAPQEFANIMRLSMQGLVSFFSPSGISDFAGQVSNASEDRELAQASDEPAEPAEDEDLCAPTTGSTGGSAPTASSGSGDGENRILSIVGLVRFGSDVGGVDPSALIGLFALINIFIGVFNLIPLLPFDGGHVSIAVYEKIQERRLGRRRYFADISRLLPLTYAVVLVLGMLFVSSLYLDLVNPIGS